MKRTVIGGVVIVQCVLLILELFLAYDSLPRRVALVLTNIAAIVSLWFYARWLHRHGRNLSWSAAGIICGAVWLDALGNFFGFYSRYGWWDHLTHGFGAAAVALVAADICAGQLRESKSFAAAAWGGLLVSQTLSAWYEISEYLGDLVFATHRVGEHFDTSIDLFYNLVGGVIGAYIWRLRSRVAEDPRKVS